MKLKSGSAIVLAIFATAAHAQSSVTLYGVVDTGLLYQNTSAATFLPHAPNTGSVFQLKDGGIYASYWGMKGAEDIGGGYKINFKLQGTFNTTNGKFGLSDTPGVTAIFNQFATVGVSGPFGTFDAGRQIVPMIYAMAETDVRGAQYFGSILTAWLGINQAAGWPGTSTNAPIGALYDSNALVYNSPKFYGASLALEYAPGGVAGHFQGGTRESAVLKYSNYGLNLSAVYYNGHDTNPFPLTYPAAPAIPATGLANNRLYYFGAMYTIAGFSVSASYGVGKNPAHSNTANFEMISGGLGYQFNSRFTITSGYYYLNDKNHSANHSTEVAAGAEYSLSQRTRAYAQVGYVANRGTMNQTIVYGAPVAPGVNTTAAMVGIRHTF
ncbi:porin [Paraburkholderia sp. MMS20-SJTN17]|uniref:Porin n=1 Tax=Paraburkholderia translucens TaxID=2886945 RepID=A0ABS8KHT9_9BURK|nr:porin [Paraburkholderia sp. MMS20-SJTN17]MCC8404003.1 porin [Paraburkholderia sp. MMS20-SJTN17]